ncbi:dihydrolipoyl dehydrogenase [Candidatus Micrarchaeota archaeon]|nr:dihydrolipoyl dehydrogenase [Candidatus Micrarchaeota archaeon]
MQNFDLIVIGAGSGLDVAAAAAARGMSVAIVEEGPMGGTCLNRGCIPTKILIHSADVVQTIKEAKEFGIDVKGYSVDFNKVMARARTVDADAASIEANLRKAKNVTLFKERGAFSGPMTLMLKEGEITADKIVIAAGTRPAIPPIEGLDKVPYMTSDEALKAEALPKELIIIGGGYIACELAHFFGSMGSKIQILQRNVRLLPDEDEEISQKFTELFSKEYPVRLSFAVRKAEKKGERIVVYGADGTAVEGTDLLIATGRVPNSDILQVEKSGIKTNKHGYIETDEYMETNVPGVWAFGDIAGKYLFKHSANLEAEYVTISIITPDHRHPVDYTAMPHAVFSHPQVAGVGATEQELKVKGEDFLVGKYMYKDTGMGEALAERDGFVKFIADYEGKILGCHIIGPEASTLLHEVLVSMKAGKCHVNDIINTVHIHPALSEVVQRGAGSV